MLSYRHAFHAGNHADVFKHCVLISVLDYMRQKTAPFVYVDTHAGAGMYSLQDEWAEKTRDYETGIGQLWSERDSVNTPQAIQMFMREIRDLNPHAKLQEYPGSPWIAQSILREQDRARLFELHPNEYQGLYTMFASNRRFKTEQRDGFQALNEVLPPVERRAVVLIDPSYEVKTDYQTVLQSVKTAYKKFPTGVYLIWYPVVNRNQINRFEQGFADSGIRNVLLAELAVKADSEQGGMTASGMIIINPPWLLAESLKSTLPYLQRVLGDGMGGFRLKQLVAE
jgi:23S rRNA (adenine2030-N6)-methyltransferase